MDGKTQKQSLKQMRIEYHQRLMLAVNEEMPEVNVTNPPNFVLTIRQMSELCEKQSKNPSATVAWVSRSVEYFFLMLNYAATVTSLLEKLLKKTSHLRSHEIYLKHFEKTINLSRLALTQARFLEENLGTIKRIVLKNLDDFSQGTPSIWNDFFGFGPALMIDPQKSDPDNHKRKRMDSNKLMISIDEQFEYDLDWMLSKDRDCFKLLVEAKAHYLAGDNTFTNLASVNDDLYRRHMDLFNIDSPQQADPSMPDPPIIQAAETKSHEAAEDAMIQDDETSHIQATPERLDNILKELDSESEPIESVLTSEVKPEEPAELGELQGRDPTEEQQKPEATNETNQNENHQPAEASEKSIEDADGSINESDETEEKPIIGRKVLPEFYKRDKLSSDHAQINCDGMLKSEMNQLVVSLVFDQIGVNFKSHIIPVFEVRVDQMRTSLEQHLVQPSQVKELLINFLADPWRTAADDWSDREPRSWLVYSVVFGGVLLISYLLIVDLVSPLVGASPTLMIKYIDKQDNILVAALARYMLSHLTWHSIGLFLGDSATALELLGSKFSLSMLKRSIHYLLLTDALRWMPSGMGLSVFILQTWIIELLVVPDQLAWQVFTHMRAVDPVDRS